MIKTHNLKFESYLFQIRKSSFIYDFGLDYLRHPDGPYSEYNCLELEAEGRYPPKIKKKIFRFDILGDRTKDIVLNDGKKLNYEPIGVGEITFKKDTRHVLGTLPQSALASTYNIIKRGEVDCIILRGHRIKYGRATIISIRFFDLADPEDFGDYI